MLCCSPYLVLVYGTRGSVPRSSRGSLVLNQFQIISSHSDQNCETITQPKTVAIKVIGVEDWTNAPLRPSSWPLLPTMMLHHQDEQSRHDWHPWSMIRVTLVFSIASWSDFWESSLKSLYSNKFTSCFMLSFPDLSEFGGNQIRTKWSFCFRPLSPSWSLLPQGRRSYHGSMDLAQR